MSDNVIPFNGKSHNEQEHSCPHCNFINGTVANFISRVKGLKVGNDDFEEEVKDLIGFVELNTRRQTLVDIAGGLIQEVKYIDGDEDEDKE